MLTIIPRLFAPEPLAALNQWLQTATWANGQSSAGPNAAKVKRNEQVAEASPGLAERRQLLLAALAANANFQAAVLPRQFTPPLFARYGQGMGYGEHLDNPLMLRGSLRADVAYTLFLTPPEDYDGGELVMNTDHAPLNVKLPAGSVVAYPASSLHRVNPVTRGLRSVAVGWVQSQVREAAQREVLYDLAHSSARLQQLEPDGSALHKLEKSRANLLRMWAL